MRPAHFKATWNHPEIIDLAKGFAQSVGPVTTYACAVHEQKLRADAEDRAPVLAVNSQERMSASVWCTYCNERNTTRSEE